MLEQEQADRVGQPVYHSAADIYNPKNYGSSFMDRRLANGGNKVGDRQRRMFSTAAKQRDPLSDAIEQANFKKVNELIRQGVDVNSLNELGETPLTQAIKRCSVAYRPPNIWKSVDFDIVSRLIESGRADINLVDGNGNSPLIAAIKNGTAEMVLLLKDYGIDTSVVNSIDEDGNTWLMRAFKDGDFKTVQALLLLEADISLENNEGDTVLEIAKNYIDRHEKDHFDYELEKTYRHFNSVIADYLRKNPFKLSDFYQKVKALNEFLRNKLSILDVKGFYRNKIAAVLKSTELSESQKNTQIAELEAERDTAIAEKSALTNKSNHSVINTEKFFDGVGDSLSGLTKQAEDLQTLMINTDRKIKIVNEYCNRMVAVADSQDLSKSEIDELIAKLEVERDAALDRVDNPTWFDKMKAYVGMR